MKKGFLLLVILLIFSFISAESISEDLHLNIQTVNASGSIVTGTFEFGFNISTNSGCSNIIYSNSTNLTTDSRGIVSYYLTNVSLNYSEQYWLCYYRDNVLVNSSKMARTPYTFRARNITLSGVEIDSNLNMTGYTITADYFYGDGSGLTGITANVSSNASEYWDNMDTINTTQMEDNGGVLNILVSWVNSLITAITNTASNNLQSNISSVNTSLIDRFDNYNYNMSDGSYNSTYEQYSYNQTGDYGYNQSSWNVSGGDLYTKDLDYNVGIGTDSPSEKLNVSGNIGASGNVTADYFIGNQADFGGGWLSDGVSIIGGNIYAQVGYFYNITSLNVTKQNLTVVENIYAGGNLSLGQKITFALGEIIDNLVDGWIRITGNLNVTGNLSLGNGQISYNDTSKSYMYYNGSTWQEFGTGSGSSTNITDYYRYYDTGWISRSDWTNVHLGSNTTKNVDSNVTHNFGVPLSNLTVKVLFSEDGTEAKVYEGLGLSGFSGGGVKSATILGVDLNQILIQTSANGVELTNNAGTTFALDGEDWYYKVIVTNVVALNSTPVFGLVPENAIMAFNQQTCPTGWIPADGTSGTPDLNNEEYDTGWLGIYDDDWTNVHLGSNNSTADSNVTHNLNANLSDLDVRVYVSTDGTDENIYESLAARGNPGTGIYQVDENNIKIQTSVYGLYIYEQDNGQGNNIDVEDWFYRIIVTKKLGFDNESSSLIYCVKTSEDSAESNSIWTTSGNSVTLNNASQNLIIQNNLTIEGNYNISCPSGFTNIENEFGQLGCIQTAEDGSATYWSAQDICFKTYGGRLPTIGEWFISMNNSALTDETDDYEHMGDPWGTNSPACGNGAITSCSYGTITTSRAYRCWIPR